MDIWALEIRETSENLRFRVKYFTSFDDALAEEKSLLLNKYRDLGGKESLSQYCTDVIEDYLCDLLNSANESFETDIYNVIERIGI